MYSKNKFLKIPVLNKKAIDTMGAGDIFHSIASVMSLISKDDNLNLLISQIAGAHAVEIIGNSSYPKFSEIINTVKFYQSSLQKKKFNLTRRLKIYPILFLKILFLSPIILVFIFINFFIKLKIKFIESRLIGHFIPSLEIFICENLDNKMNKVKVIWFVEKKLAINLF